MMQFKKNHLNFDIGNDLLEIFVDNAANIYEQLLVIYDKNS